jgi:predicted enzyme related to lactoylglutathione lyase
MELNAARVFVRDIEAAKQFYLSKLGLPLSADGSQYGYCVFRAGNMELARIFHEGPTGCVCDADVVVNPAT